MSNPAITMSFGTLAEAADIFEAMAIAFRQIAARTSTVATAAVAAVAGEAREAVAAFTAPPAAVEAPAAVDKPATRTRKPKEAAPAAVEPVATAPETSVPTVAPAPAPAVVAATPLAPLPGGRPGVITLDALRGHLKSLLDAASRAASAKPGADPQTVSLAARGAATDILSKVCPAGDLKVSTIPGARFAEAWDAISDAIALY